MQLNLAHWTFYMVKPDYQPTYLCFSQLLSVIRFIKGKPVSNWNSDLTYKGASVELVVLSCAVFFSMCHMMSLCCHVW